MPANSERPADRKSPETKKTDDAKAATAAPHKDPEMSKADVANGEKQDE